MIPKIRLGYKFKQMFETVNSDVLPLFGDKIEFTFHPVVQPWHAQGTWVHESALVVNKLKPAQTWSYCAALFAHMDDFSDATTYHLSRKDVYDKLAQFIAQNTGISVEDALSELAPANPQDTSSYNKISTERTLKNQIKFHRKHGVHVTPTVFVNGIEAGDISSSWTGDQWKDFLSPFAQ